MNIAILGFGTVGSGVYEIVEHAQTDLTKQLNVKHILIRKGKPASLPCMCDDIATILEDDEVDVVVETTSPHPINATVASNATNNLPFFIFITILRYRHRYHLLLPLIIL